MVDKATCALALIFHFRPISYHSCLSFLYYSLIVYFYFLKHYILLNVILSSDSVISENAFLLFLITLLLYFSRPLNFNPSISLSGKIIVISLIFMYHHGTLYFPFIIHIIVYKYKHMCICTHKVFQLFDHIFLLVNCYLQKSKIMYALLTMTDVYKIFCRD